MLKIKIIMLGDFNIVLEDRDSINRNANANEVNARRILKDLMLKVPRKKNVFASSCMPLLSFFQLVMEKYEKTCFNAKTNGFN